MTSGIPRILHSLYLANVYHKLHCCYFLLSLALKIAHTGQWIKLSTVHLHIYNLLSTHKSVTLSIFLRFFQNIFVLTVYIFTQLKREAVIIWKAKTKYQQHLRGQMISPLLFHNPPRFRTNLPWPLLLVTFVFRYWQPTKVKLNFIINYNNLVWKENSTGSQSKWATLRALRKMRWL